MNFFVAPSDRYGDFITSLSLCVVAANQPEPRCAVLG